MEIVSAYGDAETATGVKAEDRSTLTLNLKNWCTQVEITKPADATLLGGKTVISPINQGNTISAGGVPGFTYQIGEGSVKVALAPFGMNWAWPGSPAAATSPSVSPSPPVVFTIDASSSVTMADVLSECG